MCALPIYGRTAGVPERPLSIGRYADDVVGLLKFFGIAKADFFGESYGANAAAMIAVRHPELVRRVALYGATFGPSQDALNPEMTKLDQPPAADSRSIQFQRDRYRKIAPDPHSWPKIFEQLVGLQCNGFSREDLAYIRAPLLIVGGART